MTEPLAKFARWLDELRQMAAALEDVDDVVNHTLVELLADGVIAFSMDENGQVLMGLTDKGRAMKEAVL